MPEARKHVHSGLASTKRLHSKHDVSAHDYAIHLICPTWGGGGSVYQEVTRIKRNYAKFVHIFCINLVVLARINMINRCIQFLYDLRGGGGEVNRFSDRRISQKKLFGFLIWRIFYTNLRILLIQRIVDLSNILARIVDLACSLVIIIIIIIINFCVFPYGLFNTQLQNY